MIRYHGRMLPCFMERDGCSERAAYRVEGARVLMHVCGEHRAQAEKICGPDAAVVELAPSDGEDTLRASSLDNASLRRLPHIIEVTDEP